MKVLIITKSFVREVSYFVRYAVTAAPSIQFFLVTPYCKEPLPVPVFIPKLYCPSQIRTSFYSPSLLTVFKKFRPDVLHIFEEYSGLMAFQSTLFRDLFCRNSKIMVYSAENLQKNVRMMLHCSTKYVMARSDLAFVCSHTVRQVLEDEGYPKPIEVFPLGVDTSEFFKFPVDQLKTQLNLDGKYVLGYVGRLIDIKGVRLLVELLRYLPDDVHLLLVGSGPEEQRLQTAALNAHLDRRIHFIGNVAYEALPQYINCMDIGLVPSKTTKRWKEQFGRVIIEFLSCEVPVIGSNSGSIPEVLGDAGWIFHEQDMEELVALVKTLLAHPEQRRELGKRGRERVMARYSTDIMGERLLTMYKTLMLQTQQQIQE